jgi:hypothetical protein
MSLKYIGSRGVAILLSAALCNLPQYLAAQSTTQAASQTAQDQNTSPATEEQAAPAQNTQPGSPRPDPAQAPLSPVPSTRSVDNNSIPPDAPSEVQRSQQTQPATTNMTTQAPEPQRPAIPLGTATAQQGVTRGGAASKPAGEAIAPAKQKQVHSLLIRVALVAAGAAAVGTVVGLTRGTSSVPPGAR